MTRSTSELRRLWAPPCAGPFARIALHGDGIVAVRPAVVDAVEALNAALVAHDYRTRRADTGAYNCRQITGGDDYSLHAYGIALDLNWSTNPYGPTLVTDMPPAMIAAIEAIRTRGGAVVWRWGGRYRGNKDAMHFEVVASPAELARGLDVTTIPGRRPTTPTTPTTEDPADMTPDQIDTLNAAARDAATAAKAALKAADAAREAAASAAAAVDLAEKIGERVYSMHAGDYGDAGSTAKRGNLGFLDRRLAPITTRLDALAAAVEALRKP